MFCTISSSVPTSETFNYSNADVILRSSAPHSVDFKVHKIILTISSPVFETMFTLPDASKEENTQTDLPVVDISEPYDVLDALLRVIYPLPDPIFDDLNSLRPVIEAARKFDMHAVLTTLRRALVSNVLLQSQPLQIFMVAASLDFEEEAKIASSHTLRFHLMDVPLLEEMKSVPAHYYHRLLTMHRRRGKAAQMEVQKISPTCRGGCLSSFWTSWKSDACVELLERPTSDVVFTPEFMYRNQRSMACNNINNNYYCDRFSLLPNLKMAIDSLPDTI